MAASERIEISVVIPVLNETENVEDLHRELTAALAPLRRSYELVLVDDGSTDGTREKLLGLEARDQRVRPILLRRNFGQTAAFSAGFDRARGEIVVTSDGDLQTAPADIPRLVARREAGGLDMVCGWRKSRKDPPSKRLPSLLANRLISWSTGVHLHDYGCSLKAMRAEVVKGVRLYGEMHRFIPAVASWMGVRLEEIEVNHRPRTRGKSKYGIGRTLRVLLDLFTVKFLLSYGTRPAHLFGLMGLAIGGRPLLLLGALLFLTGLMLVSLGLIGELLVRIYHESQGKPTYVVQERWPSREREKEPALPPR